MKLTNLIDGRLAEADECCSVRDALLGGSGTYVQLEGSGYDWFLICRCCWGKETHDWLEDNSNDTESGAYPCTVCGGTGTFLVQLPGEVQ